MKIHDMLSKRDEDPKVDKKYVSIVAGLKEGGSVELEVFEMNPYEAIFLIEKYLVEREMEEVRKVQNPLNN